MLLIDKHLKKRNINDIILKEVKMTDIEIQSRYKKKKIISVAKKFDITRENLVLYGDYMAKLKGVDTNRNGKLILVTATNPTKYGEGKTTVSIGLSDALNLLGEKSVLALREPSLGPVFGIKGGATGGGYSQIAPMEDINLHFTGDFHAITSANNLLCSIIDNSIYFGNQLQLDPEKINFHRCIDINDRALRDIDINIDGKFIRKEKFNITASSEIMGIMTLSKDIDDLKKRIGNIVIGFDINNNPVFARQLKCEDAIAILLKDCLKPNIVQTLAGNLALVHSGPFANISHGCNSVVATKYGLKLGDFCVTEAGFGADLGAQKFLDFVCREGEFSPSAVVLVSTLRSIKYNGGADGEVENVIKNGIENIFHHYKNLSKVYGMKVVVALNRFSTDDDNELNLAMRLLRENRIEVCLCEPYKLGGKGCLELAKKVIDISEKAKLKSVYNKNDDLLLKVEKIAKNIYGAEKVILAEHAKAKLELIRKIKLNKLPVIIAKTQYSLTDDKDKIGSVKNFDFTITDFEINSGAGYIVAIAGKMLLMPGLSKTPNAINMKINNNLNISGLF